MDYLTTLINQIIDSRLSEHRVSQPAIVEEFDPETMTVQVRPAEKLSIATEDGEQVESAASIVEVPVIMPANAGFGVTLPISKGDYVLLVHLDRSIDSFQDTGEEQPQTEYRDHSLSDTVAIPGWKPNPKTYNAAAKRDASVQRYDGKNMQIRSFDGKINITVKSSSLDIVAGGAKMTYQDGTFKITGADLVVEGQDIRVNGGDVIADGISLKEHIHTGDSGGKTSKPE